MPQPLIALIIGSSILLLFLLLFWPRGGLIGYIQKSERLNSKVLREDALKHIHKTERHDHSCSINSLAGTLGISQARATKLLHELTAQDLVNLEGENFVLTSSGREYALRILRAHRLLERYLAEETGYHETEWHDRAERIEHQLSPDEANALSVQLGHPTHDPHGDPIPTKTGEMVLHGGVPLTDIPIDQPFQIVHIEDEPEEIYTQLVAEGLYPGMQVRLIDKTSTRVIFWGNGDEHLLAPIFAANVSVIPVSLENSPAECVGAPLNSLKPGYSGEVLTISPRMRGAERRRMMDLGILPGTIIQSDFISPGGDPTAYLIRDTLIAIRNEQAEFIRIKPVEN